MMSKTSIAESTSRTCVSILISREKGDIFSREAAREAGRRLMNQRGLGNTALDMKVLVGTS
jgi:hypothetical protein